MTTKEIVFCFGMNGSGQVKMNVMASKVIGPTVVIIGGGLSGAAVAYNLLSRVSVPPQVVIIEPRPLLGQGLAYSARDPLHRLNVPHGKMSLVSDRPEDFADWLRDPGGPTLPADSATLTGQIFAPRSVFGRYVSERLAPFLASGRLRHVVGTATALRRVGDGFIVTLEPVDRDGRRQEPEEIKAASAVLAVAHPSPAIPEPLQPLAGTEYLVADPFVPGALDAIAPDERLLVVGTGLTSADILSTLQGRHRAAIHVLSRHGWRSRPHGPTQAETNEDFSIDPETTASALLRRVRRALAEDATRGLTWHAVFDRLRAQGPAIWAALPLDERRRFLRHLRGLWDVHRFRIAPQSLAAVETMERTRRAQFVKGRIKSLEVGFDGLAVGW